MVMVIEVNFRQRMEELDTRALRAVLRGLLEEVSVVTEILEQRGPYDPRQPDEWNPAQRRQRLRAVK